MVIYLNNANVVFAECACLELVRAGILCVFVFIAGKSQLKMRNLVEESLLQSVIQVPQLGKHLPEVLSFACTEPTIVF